MSGGWPGLGGRGEAPGGRAARAGPARAGSGWGRSGGRGRAGPGRGPVARAGAAVAVLPGAAPRGDLVAAWSWEVPRVAGVVGGFPFRTDKTCFLCSGWRITGAASKNSVICRSVISYLLVLGIAGSELKALEGELFD